MSTPAPLARRTDPATSHAAAETARRRRTLVRTSVLAVLLEHPGGLTHDELIRAHRAHAAASPSWPDATDSSIRTRCHELVRDQLVEPIPNVYRKTRAGRRSRIWRATRTHA